MDVCWNLLCLLLKLTMNTVVNLILTLKQVKFTNMKMCKHIIVGSVYLCVGENVGVFVGDDKRSCLIDVCMCCVFACVSEIFGVWLFNCVNHFVCT